MKFDYDYYKRSLFSVPVVLIALFSCLLFVTIFFSIVGKKNVIENKIMSIVAYIILFCFILFGLIDSMGKLQYGIKLNTETPNDTSTITGEIEKIEELKNPFTHDYKIAPIGRVNAQLITISGKKYYFMIKGDLEIGDKVEIKYLPKSTIVLEVNIIETE